MMPRTNRTQFAVLGMLLSGPRTGYDLKRDFEEQISHFWSESLGQIYPTLQQLHAQKLVSRSVRRGDGRPDRKIYRITKRGEAAFRDWLQQPAAAMHWRNELLLKVFFGHEMTPDIVLQHVERLENEQREIRSLYRHFAEEIETRDATPERRLYWRLALSSGQHINHARLAWCREAKAAIEEHLHQQPTGTDR